MSKNKGFVFIGRCDRWEDGLNDYHDLYDRIIMYTQIDPTSAPAISVAELAGQSFLQPPVDGRFFFFFNSQLSKGNQF